MRVLPTSSRLHFPGDSRDRLGVEGGAGGWKELAFFLFDMRAVCTRQLVAERFDLAARRVVVRAEIAREAFESGMQRFVLAMLAREAFENRRELCARREARKERLLFVLLVAADRTREEPRNVPDELDIDLRGGGRPREIVEPLLEPPV